MELVLVSTQARVEARKGLQVGWEVGVRVEAQAGRRLRLLWL
jgi:hypothetical protein